MDTSGERRERGKTTAYLEGLKNENYTFSSTFDEGERSHLACCSGKLCYLDTCINTGHSVRRRGRTDKRCTAYA